MEQITTGLKVPLKRYVPTTWRSIKKQEHSRNVYTDHGIAHADFLWKVRQNDRAMRVFSKLYNCNPGDLLVSFEGVAVQTPPEKTPGGNGWYKNCRYHVDQSFTHKKRECFQSWVTAHGIAPGDYTVGFFVGSHHSFRAFGDKFNITAKDDFFKLRTREHMHFYETRHRQIRITCKAGSMVLWDSRLLHSDLGPLRGRETPNFMTACLLSYSPRLVVPQRVLEKRIGLFRKRSATTHWSNSRLKAVPGKKFKLDAEGHGLRKLKTKPQETDELKSLVGYPNSVLSRSPFMYKRPNMTYK